MKCSKVIILIKVFDKLKWNSVGDVGIYLSLLLFFKKVKISCICKARIMMMRKLIPLNNKPAESSIHNQTH